MNRDLGDLDQSLRRVTLPNGVVITAQFYDDQPILTIEALPPEPRVPVRKEYIVRAAWKPEGFVLTPSKGRKEDDTYVDWGLPSRKLDTTGERLNIELDGNGNPVNEIGLTEEGSLPQVIINRFANNKYLDNMEFITGLSEIEGVQYQNARRAASYNALPATDVSYVGWHLYYEPWGFQTPDDDTGYEEVGYYQKWGEDETDPLVSAAYEKLTYSNGDVEYKLIKTQFAEDGSDNYYESKAGLVDDGSGNLVDAWFCHRPEELLYEIKPKEDLFQYTNFLRGNVGEASVYREIRGDGNAAYLTSYQVTATGLFYHSHQDFAVGYQTTGGRLQNATGRESFMSFAHNVRENILAIQELPDEVLSGDKTYGQYLGELWQNSPIHYPNMVDSNWTELSIPFFWTYGGSKLASHQIGYFGTADLTERDVYGSDPTENIAEEFNPPVEGATTWTQIFHAREAWVPIYDMLHEGVHGTVGWFNTSNGWSHSNYPGTRRFGYGKHIYELPSSLAPAQFLGDEPDEDEFLCCVGCAMIEVDGEKYIRGVYYESDMVPAALKDDFFYPHEGQWIKMTVVRFPIRLQATSEMPWRKDIPGEWEIEYEYTWFASEGWQVNPPGKVNFNSDGTKFTFSMHKLGENIVNEVMDYRGKDWNEDRSEPALPRIDIQTVHFEWDDTILTTFAEMTEYAPDPLVAQVTCWKDDPEGPYQNSDQTVFYERTLSGQIELFPHYNDQDVLSYITLAVDEKTYQRGNRLHGVGDFEYADREDYCYRYRKLIFPSGKEVVIMQQYVEERWTTTFPSNPQAPGWRPWPGDGLSSFFCVIHYLDELREDIVYSRITTEKHVVDYGFPNLWYRVDGNIDYIIDLDKDDELNADGNPRIEEIIGTIEFDPNNPDLTQSALNVYDIDGDEWEQNWRYPDSTAIYNTEFSPCVVFVIQNDEYSRVPPGMIGANTSGFTLPENYVVTALSRSPEPLNPEPEDGRYDRQPYRGYPEQPMDHPAGRPFIDDYTVSCYTGYTYSGDQSIWYHGTALSPYSYQRCNIAPLFGKGEEVGCKVLRYEDRIIVRVGINHLHKYGYNAPEYFKPAGSSFSWSEWTFNKPPEDKEVFIWSNFDLDEVLGIEDIRDIWPMGKIV